MKRHYVIASHTKLAAGMADTLKFFVTKDIDLIVLTAYVDNKPIDAQVKNIFSNISAEDEIIILTDIMGGSVNQQFFSYIYRPHTHVISGVNLPLVMAIVMEPTDDYLIPERIRQIIDEAKQQLVYVNDRAQENAGDEDE